MLGAPEAEITREFVRQSRVVVDETFEVDPSYAAVVQQHPERRFPDARFVFGDPAGRKRMLRT